MHAADTKHTLDPEGAILAPPSLYDRLGGVYNIATVIDDFV